jgi:hypothetical protein
MRWILIVTIVSKDRIEAAKKLKITKRTLDTHLQEVCKTLGVNNINQAALRMGILKFNYDDIGTWVDKETVEVAPGVTLNLLGDDND